MFVFLIDNSQNENFEEKATDTFIAFSEATHDHCEANFERTVIFHMAASDRILAYKKYQKSRDMAKILVIPRF